MQAKTQIAAAVVPPPVRWSPQGSVPAKPRNVPPPFPGAKVHAVVQQAKRKRQDDDEEDGDGDYVDSSEKRQERFTFPKDLREDVIRETAHKKTKFNDTAFQAVYTCVNCGRPIASIDNSGKFAEAEFNYTSKKKQNKKKQTAVTLDHNPVWSKRLAGLNKKKASREEKKEDYLDKTRLRALCKKCNEKHIYEGKNIPDYDSDEDGSRRPGTPPNEPENKGQFSKYLVA